MRARLIAVVAVGLLFLGSSTAYGAYRTGAVVGAGGSVKSGSFGVTGTTPLDLTAMYPGEKRTGVLTLARTGEGRWVYTVGAATVAGGTVKVYSTATCSGAVLTLPFTQTTVQAGTATPQYCVEVTASATLAPGQTVSISLPVSAQSRSTN